jgi:hypothetical protein
MYVYRQGGTPTSDGSLSSALFSADSDKTAMNDITNPRSFLSNGSAGGLSIYNISSIGETMSFYADVDGPDENFYRESFENQSLTNFDWMVDEEHPWTITNEEASHGDYSIVSAPIGNNQTSRIEMTATISNGFIQFYLRTSTRLNGGFLRFYINNMEIQSWSGNNNWRFFWLPINAGTYNFAWEYYKNSQVAGGQDKVWVDQIGFPDITGHILYPVRNLSGTHSGRNVTLNWVLPYATSLPNPPTLSGYKVFQSNVQINTSLLPANVSEYTIQNSAGGNMIFWLVAVYAEGEADVSNSVQISFPPAPPQNLTGSAENDGVRLNWEFPYNAQFLAGFRVIRNGTNITGANPVPTNSLTYLDINPPGGELKYQIRAMYSSPASVSEPSNTLTITFLGATDDELPVLRTELRKNYPNPFNPETVINFSLKQENQVKLEIFNVKGELIKTLVNGVMPSGQHHIIWNGTNEIGKATASGIYFYKMETDDYQSVRKMILLK